MSLTVQTIQSLGDDLRRDATSGTIDTAKRLRALISTLQEIHAYADWKFTTRQLTFNYFGGETDYNLPDTLNIADFKNIADLRFEDDNAVRFTNIKQNDFDLQNGKGSSDNFYTVEYRDGDPILRINTMGGEASTLLGDTSSYNGNGTWTADTSGSDASNVSTDTTNMKDGSGSVKYDLVVGQSVNNYGDISVTTISQTDLSSYRDYGAAFMWFYIPAIDAITGGTLTWGSDSSNNYSKAVTTTSQNAALTVGWNRLKIDWSGVTTTGSPTITAIDYIKWRTSYGAGQSSDTDFRINGLTFALPTRMDLLYYSSYIAKNTSGTWITEPTSTSDLLLIPDRYRNVVVEGYVSNLLYQMGKSTEGDKHYARFLTGLKAMGKEFGVFPAKESKTFKPSIRWS